jgi:predicted DNA-binding protein (UPF0251 family)
MKTIQDLPSLIDSELLLGEKLLRLLDLKKEAVIQNDLDKIDDLTKEENEALHDIEECGFERQETILHLSKTPEYRVTEKLGDFIPQIKEINLKESLKLKRKDLMALYKNIADASKLNGELLAQSMGITQQVFSRLSNVDRRTKNSNYDRFSEKKSAKPGYHVPSFNRQG